MTGRDELTVARSGSFISGRDKRSDEIKTALGALRRDLDGKAVPQLVVFNSDTHSLTAGAARFMFPWRGTAITGTAEPFIVLPTACTARNLGLTWRVAGTGTGTITATLRREFADTSLTTVKKPATSDDMQAVFNRSDRVKFDAGDRVSVKLVTTGTISASPTDITVVFEVIY